MPKHDWKPDEYWSIRVRPDETINPDTMETLKRKYGYRSLGDMFRDLVERAYLSPTAIDCTSDYANLHEEKS